MTTSSWQPTTMRIPWLIKIHRGGNAEQYTVDKNTRGWQGDADKVMNS